MQAQPISILFICKAFNYNYDEDIRREYDVFAMYPPSIPGMDFNKITETMWNLRIHLEESVLYQQGYVDAYKVSIRCPNGDIYSFETEERDFELNTSYDKQALNESIYANDAIYNIEHTKATSQSTITGNFDMFYNELTVRIPKLWPQQSGCQLKSCRTC